MAVTFKLVSSETVPLTPEIAEKHRSMTGSPTERSLDPKRVKFLKEKLVAGLFLPPSWSTVKYKDTEMRMNGQHSSTALCDDPELFPLGLKVHFDRFETDSQEGMVHLFRQFDCRQSGRSTVDISGAYMKLHEGLRKVDPALGLKCAQGIRWYLGAQALPAPSGDNLGELFNKELYHPFILWMNDIEWKKAAELRHASVIACMYATFSQNQSDAQAFWDAVIYRRHQFDEEHPATTLENYLCAVQRKEAPFQNGRKPKPAEMYEACAQAWNAFRAEKPISLKVLSKVDPKKKGLSEIAA